MSYVGAAVLTAISVSVAAVQSRLKTGHPFRPTS